jgi:hypothetical protein
MPDSGKPVQFVNVPEAGVPRAGVTNVGEVANTSAPEPVSPVTALARLALEGVARKVATPVPSPLIPVETGRPVQFVSVPEAGVPRAGVTSVGDVANTKAPLPVSPVTADAKFALDGVARNVAMPVPSPETPVEIGRPVAFVSVAADGVPKSGVTRAGDVANTSEPEPVSFVTAEARLALDGVARNVATPVPSPLIPVETGRPSQFVNVPLAGVPKTGATNVLLVSVSTPSSVASVPVVGSVRLVVAVTVNVAPNAPEIVSVEESLLATPVPPCWGDTTPVIT